MNIRLQEIKHGSVEYALTIALRDRVLRHPLGLYFTPEQLEEEKNEFHLSAWQGNELLGCLVLKPIDAYIVKMRQVAVSPQAQGQGIGKMLVAWSETFAREHLFTNMQLHARDSAVDFYLQLGYEVFGEPFTEVSIPHRAMHKQL
ncbi:MAG: GNAT family N-acetyltransferase [Sphingobacteriaceae bacterium]|nr:GNAT family N-acetyltransferase [Sphingobacteriaceae bacterium]